MTKIEWTDETWNPVHGCTKVSQGCKNCYAERFAKRQRKDFSKVEIHPDRLDLPLHWRKPRRVFVNSMGDLFHDDVQFEFTKRVFDITGRCLQHTFQILTKRPARMLAFAKWLAGPDHISVASWPRNVWLGVSVENQEAADERIPLLLQTPAAVRFVSVEPMLGALDLRRWLPVTIHTEMHNPEGAQEWNMQPLLDWVVIGGESGPGARPFDIAWARDLIRQCQTAGVPVFMKQVGSNPVCVDVTTRHYGNGTTRQWIKPAKLKDRKGGDPSEWPKDIRVREYPTNSVRRR